MIHNHQKVNQNTIFRRPIIHRNISQSFSLPRGVDPQSVTSSMAKDGTLTISAPLPPALRGPQSAERLVPVKHR